MSDIVDRLRERQVQRWVHSTGETPRADGYRKDAECQEAAGEIERLRAALTVAQELAAHYAERERCAAWVDARRDAYCADFGAVDPSTGTLEFGRGSHAEAKHDYVSDLIEIADGLRALGPGNPDL